MSNYSYLELQQGDILTNALGTRRIRIIRSDLRKTITQHRRVFYYSVLDAAGEIDYNDQKTQNAFLQAFPIKVSA